jgi:hypothetical protein
MYRPDPRIVARLKEYDTDLDVRWDTIDGRWVVTWRSKDVWTVCENDNSYRPLDERVVTQARLQDAWQHKSSEQMMRIRAEEGHRLRGLEKKRRLDEFRQEMVEDGYQKVFGVGKFPGWSPNEART